MSTSLLMETPLYSWHSAHGGRLVEFGGWSMPVQYTTIIEEHRAVRRRVGLFDISHMGRLRFDGPDVVDWLEMSTTNHVARLKPGQIQYSLMANDHGGLIDDILVYRLPDGSYRVVCNASNRTNVVERFQALRAGRDARLLDETCVLAMIAVQGPKAVDVVAAISDDPGLPELGYYRCGVTHQVAGVPAGTPNLVSRTGYTGEDGFELIVPAASAEAVWNALLEAGARSGITPCGLGARDTLRFEAAMPLYGHELGPDITPFEAGVGWAVKLQKGPFAGREALLESSTHPARTRVGLALEGKRIARQGAPVLDTAGQRVGEVTSGTFSPTLEKSLAMALVRPQVAPLATELVVDIRGRSEPARVVPLPFYKRPAS
jgi:aminomethyltransferase